MYYDFCNFYSLFVCLQEVLSRLLGREMALQSKCEEQSQNSQFPRTCQVDTALHGNVITEKGEAWDSPSEPASWSHLMAEL